MPKVSVIIPAHQCSNFLFDAIDSVLAQAYEDYELIVVDDGSTDGTAAAVAKYGNQVKYIFQQNRGVASARNTGILAGQGEYLAFLDADDVWLPNKLESEVKFLDAHDEIGLVYSDYTYFGTRPISKTRGFEDVPLMCGCVLKKLFWHNPICTSAVLIRRSCFEKVGLFDESLVHGEDRDMWLRIARCFEIGYIDVPLARYRLHQKNAHLDTERMLKGMIAVREKYLESNKSLLDKDDLDVMMDFQRRSHRGLGIWYLTNGFPVKAREALREYSRLYAGGSIAYILWLITFLPPRLVSWLWRHMQKPV
ncbi:glycosyltransferase [Chloroflexota bacterium]